MSRNSISIFFLNIKYNFFSYDNVTRMFNTHIRNDYCTKRFKIHKIIKQSYKTTITDK